MPYLKKCTPENEPVDCRILTAALELFVERGYHNVSVHDVQKRANVSIGSIYNHFGGKEGIAKALYHHLINEFDELVQDVLAEASGARARCNLIIQRLFEYTETRRHIIAYMLHAKHREFMPEEPPLCSSSPFVALRDIVRQGMEDGEIRQGDPWVITSVLFGGAIRLVQLRLDGVIDAPLMTHYEELVEATWQGLGSA